MRRYYQSLIIKLNYVEGPSNTSVESASNAVRFSPFLFFLCRCYPPQSSSPRRMVVFIASPSLSADYRFPLSLYSSLADCCIRCPGSLSCLVFTFITAVFPLLFRILHLWLLIKPVLLASSTLCCILPCLMIFVSGFFDLCLPLLSSLSPAFAPSGLCFFLVDYFAFALLSADQGRHFKA